MARRTADWNEGLAQDLKKPEIAREFILAAIADGLPLQRVLAKAVRAYGLKEFAAKARMASSNVHRTINPSHNPTLSSLNRILKIFGLKLSVAPEKRDSGKRQKAA
jgi:DNA-binding phage protein